ncbi:MAG: DIP1984 family protein [Holophagales bacterium]|nr:DIP1984 family protein [Holophagales bacterium]
MKLSEALSIRADLQKRMAQVLERACNCATYQEGTKPPEDANVLYREYGELAAQCEALVQRINQTNSATRIEGAKTISDVIAARDTSACAPKPHVDSRTPRLIRLHVSAVPRSARSPVSTSRPSARNSMRS